MRLRFWNVVRVLVCYSLTAGCTSQRDTAPREDTRVAPAELLGTWRWVSSRSAYRIHRPDSGQVVTIMFSRDGRFSERIPAEQRSGTYEIGAGIWESTERMSTVLLDSSSFFSAFSPVLEFGYRISADTLELRSFSSHPLHHFFIREPSMPTD